MRMFIICLHKMALTIAVYHFADLPEQEIAVGGGDIKQESL